MACAPHVAGAAAATGSESQRKTASVVAMRNGERTFSEPALTTSVLHPQTAFTCARALCVPAWARARRLLPVRRFLMPLLGQTMDSPAVAEYRQRFPYHTLEADGDRGTVRFRFGADA